MNHFEYGFFDELEKIATNKAEVASWRDYLRRRYPELKGASRGYLGGIANTRAQFRLGTTGRLEEPTTDPRFHSRNFRFDVSIPDPNVPGGRLVANSEQRTKFIERIKNRNREAIDYMKAPSRAELGVTPFGVLNSYGGRHIRPTLKRGIAVK